VFLGDFVECIFIDDMVCGVVFIDVFIGIFVVSCFVDL